MRLTTEFVLDATATCAACLADENARPGSRCGCWISELRISVTGDVVDHGDTHAPTITLLAIREVESGVDWPASDVACLLPQDKEQMEEKLWGAYLVTAKAQALVEANRVAEFVRLQVELAMRLGCRLEEVRRYLQALRETALSPPRDVRAVPLSSSEAA